jgi:hypothetical protein
VLVSGVGPESRRLGIRRRELAQLAACLTAGPRSWLGLLGGSSAIHGKLRFALLGVGLGLAWRERAERDRRSQALLLAWPWSALLASASAACAVLHEG